MNPFKRAIFAGLVGEQEESNDVKRAMAIAMSANKMEEEERELMEKDQKELGDIPGRWKDGRPDWAAQFLAGLMQGMSMTKAARLAKIHVSCIQRRKQYDTEFAAALKDAAAIGTEFLEYEAARRAYHGTLKPVFFQGQKCGVVREYSDTLLMFMLKARKPEVYRDMRENGKRSSLSVSIQTNVDAINLLNSLMKKDPQLEVTYADIDDAGRGVEESTPPDITSTPGDSGYDGEVEASRPLDENQPGVSEGLEDGQQSDGDQRTIPAREELAGEHILPFLGTPPVAGDEDSTR